MQLTKGQRVYYTGDRANSEDYGTIIDVIPADRYAPERYTIELEDGRIFKGVYGIMFDDEIGRRFWPAEEWGADRKRRMDEFKARYSRR